MRTYHTDEPQIITVKQDTLINEAFDKSGSSFSDKYTLLGIIDIPPDIGALATTIDVSYRYHITYPGCNSSGRPVAEITHFANLNLVQLGKTPITTGFQSAYMSGVMTDSHQVSQHIPISGSPDRDINGKTITINIKISLTDDVRNDIRNDWMVKIFDVKISYHGNFIKDI